METASNLPSTRTFPTEYIRRNQNNIPISFDFKIPAEIKFFKIGNATRQRASRSDRSYRGTGVPACRRLKNALEKTLRKSSFQVGTYGCIDTIDLCQIRIDTGRLIEKPRGNQKTPSQTGLISKKSNVRHLREIHTGIINAGPDFEHVACLLRASAGNNRIKNHAPNMADFRGAPFFTKSFESAVSRMSITAGLWHD